ncbi:MAG: hypothetical protein M1374_00940 [Firmicutes bacterium]|jgi:hypothetical protein|nr:hypothetical protein [Bacillota bacterium]
MKEDCKHYQSRTYPSGEVARFCRIDLAPEAPWRCPEQCPGYEKRLGDAGFERGSLVEPTIEEEPLGNGESGSDIAKLLDEAEDIVNSIVPDALAEIQKKNERKSSLNKNGFFANLKKRFRRK